MAAAILAHYAPFIKTIHTAGIRPQIMDGYAMQILKANNIPFIEKEPSFLFDFHVQEYDYIVLLSQKAKQKTLEWIDEKSTQQKFLTWQISTPKVFANREETLQHYQHIFDEIKGNIIENLKIFT